MNTRTYIQDLLDAETELKAGRHEAEFNRLAVQLSDFTAAASEKQISYAKAIVGRNQSKAVETTGQYGDDVDGWEPVTILSGLGTEVLRVRFQDGLENWVDAADVKVSA